MMTEQVRHLTSTVNKITTIGDQNERDTADTYYLDKRVKKLIASQNLLRKQKCIIQKNQLELYEILPRCILDFEKLNFASCLEMKLILKKAISTLYGTASVNLKELELLLMFNYDNFTNNLPLQGFEDET
jgi:hypothetical protein